MARWKEGLIYNSAFHASRPLLKLSVNIENSKIKIWVAEAYVEAVSSGMEAGLRRLQFGAAATQDGQEEPVAAAAAADFRSHFADKGRGKGKKGKSKKPRASVYGCQRFLQGKQRDPERCSRTSTLCKIFFFSLSEEVCLWRGWRRSLFVEQAICRGIGGLIEEANANTDETRSWRSWRTAAVSPTTAPTAAATFGVSFRSLCGSRSVG